MTAQPDLTELQPLARVIAEKVSTVPVRHCPGGTDDLVAALTLAVAIYVSREVLPPGVLETVVRSAATSDEQADALLAPLDAVREVARRLAAHAVGFQDVLDDSDRGPWGRTVGADIAALQAALGETQHGTQAQPPRHRWAVETRDGLADEWAPGTRFLNRHHAVERYEALTKSHPTWKDGTPVERRLVRETVTYIVEQPAALSQPSCPGFEKEYQGVSDAKRRLANCKHCGKPGAAHSTEEPTR